MTDRMLRRGEVERITALSKSTLYRMIARGDFPAPVRIGARAVGWRGSVIQEWVSARCEMAERGLCR
ncbi:AlpA family phage regulatory protein [Salipiger pacificus]|nr:AlpA family phage regulatory protein [Alloyangia pacifica]